MVKKKSSLWDKYWDIDRKERALRIKLNEVDKIIDEKKKEEITQEEWDRQAKLQKLIAICEQKKSVIDQMLEQNIENGSLYRYRK